MQCWPTLLWGRFNKTLQVKVLKLKLNFFAGCIKCDKNSSVEFEASRFSLDSSPGFSLSGRRILLGGKLRCSVIFRSRNFSENFTKWFHSGNLFSEYPNNGTIGLTNYWKFAIQAISHATYCYKWVQGILFINWSNWYWGFYSGHKVVCLMACVWCLQSEVLNHIQQNGEQNLGMLGSSSTKPIRYMNSQPSE